MRKLISLALVAGLAPFAFAGGNSAQATGSAAINIFAPVWVRQTQSLDFGSVVLDNLKVDATITVTAANGSNGSIGTPSLTYSHCSALAAGATGGQTTPKQGAFNFTWDKRVQDVYLGVPATVSLVGPQGLTAAIKTNDTTHSSEFVSTGGHNGATRTNSFAVGGTVTIPGKDGQQVGQWNGSYSVTVAYL
jgi:hypothetical protein